MSEPRKYQLAGGLGNQLFIYARYLRDKLEGTDSSYYYKSVGEPREFSISVPCPLGDQSLPRCFDYFQSKEDVDEIPSDMLDLFNIELSACGEAIKERVIGKQVVFIRTLFRHDPDLYTEVVLEKMLRLLCVGAVFITDDAEALKKFLPDEFKDSIITTHDIPPMDVLAAASFAEDILTHKVSTFGWWAKWANLKRRNLLDMLDLPQSYTRSTNHGMPLAYQEPLPVIPGMQTINIITTEVTEPPEFKEVATTLGASVIDVTDSCYDSDWWDGRLFVCFVRSPFDSFQVAGSMPDIELCTWILERRNLDGFLVLRYEDYVNDSDKLKKDIGNFIQRKLKPSTSCDLPGIMSLGSAISHNDMVAIAEKYKAYIDAFNYVNYKGRRHVTIGGGTGNQLFGISQVRKAEEDGWICGWSYTENNHRNWELDIGGCPRIKDLDGYDDKTTLRFDGLIWEKVPKNMTDLFNFTLDPHYEALKERVKDLVVVFIRLDDFGYAHPAGFPPISVVNEIREKYKDRHVLIVSDDPELAKDRYPGFYDYLPRRENESDLQLLLALSFASTVQTCRWSSFGWWSKWLKDQREGTADFYEDNFVHEPLPKIKTIRIADGSSCCAVSYSPPQHIKDGGVHMKGVALAHAKAVTKMLHEGEYPCLILEADATALDCKRRIPVDKNEPLVFVGLSRVVLPINGVAEPTPGVRHSATINAIVSKGHFAHAGVMTTHAIVYNNPAGAMLMLEACFASLRGEGPIDVTIHQQALKMGVSIKYLTLPWFRQYDQNAVFTSHSRKLVGKQLTTDMGCRDLQESDFI